MNALPDPKAFRAELDASSPQSPATMSEARLRLRELLAAEATLEKLFSLGSYAIVNEVAIWRLHISLNRIVEISEEADDVADDQLAAEVAALAA